MFEETSLALLQRKWRLWYKMLDQNKDGTLTRDDYKTCVTNVESYYKDQVSEEKLEEMRQGYQVFWEQILFGKMLHKDSLDENELLVTLTNLYNKDRDSFIQMVRQMMESIIKVSDIDGNGMISFKEYVLLFSACGTKDQAFLRRMFDQYSPSAEDEIPFLPLLETWVDLITGDDPSKENIAVKAYAGN